MTAVLPAGLEPSDEIEVNWAREGKKTTVTIKLGKAKIVVSTTPKSAGLVPWLVASLPQILEAAWAAMDDDAQEAP